MSVVRAVLALLSLLSCDALVVTPRAARLTCTRGMSAQSSMTPPILEQRVPVLQMMAEEGESTAALVGFMGGGLALIFGAAFCTSTGSPPTGLAVAGLAFAVMYLGANFATGAAE